MTEVEKKDWTIKNRKGRYRNVSPFSFLMLCYAMLIWMILQICKTSFFLHILSLNFFLATILHYFLLLFIFAYFYYVMSYHVMSCHVTSWTDINWHNSLFFSYFFLFYPFLLLFTVIFLFFSFFLILLFFYITSCHVMSCHGQKNKKMQKGLGNSFSPHKIGPVCKISCF